MSTHNADTNHNGYYEHHGPVTIASDFQNISIYDRDVDKHYKKQ